MKMTLDVSEDLLLNKIHIDLHNLEENINKLEENNIKLNNISEENRNNWINELQVKKRDGTLEVFDISKILKRIKSLCHGLNPEYIDPIKIAEVTLKGSYDKITTEELDTLTADMCASNLTKHPDYGLLASRLSVSILHKKTKDNFFEVTKELYEYKNMFGEDDPLVTDKYFMFVKKNKDLNKLMKILYEKSLNLS